MGRGMGEDDQGSGSGHGNDGERAYRPAAPADGGVAARRLARVAVLAAAGAFVVLVLALESGGLEVAAALVLGLALGAVGVWGLLAYRGVVRVLGALLALAVPVAVGAYLIVDGLWLMALGLAACWVATLACARAALRRANPERRRRPVVAARPRKPVLIMNPKSGGGKVERFRLDERARELGARVILLDPSEPVDVTALAREAVAGGADLLGVAGGDGTQALVAAVAMEHDVPFLVVSAGTRNHFAMDLGLDRTDPARCLDALTDGEELRVDLGFVVSKGSSTGKGSSTTRGFDDARPFVNTVSFGVYADVVQHPEYRDAKAGTALSLMPDLLVGEGAQPVDASADSTELIAQQALLVSNNPYASPDVLGDTGRRLRLDTGRLGVLGLRVQSAVEAADLAVRGTQSPGLTVTTADRVEVTASAEEIAVAVDGEALRMRTPVVCALRPRALRVVVPRHRPGVPAPAPRLDWRRLLELALSRPPHTPSG
ncbi:diacylglycerol kinase family protein [Streptomyces sp. NPDC001941]|uniref:diacylglycerol/lipid kinase family protein n=1 Tax=Streptomyces sp. NPDC001941 TaxID=3154659 RepID=UPI0033178A82